MANIVISGDSSGSVTLSAPAVSGTTVLTLPTTSGTLVVTGGAQTIEFADGTVSAPSITNSGDTNTGIYFPAADTIAFTEGGVESMRIDASGNLAIGATTFNQKLTIGGINANNNTNQNSIEFQDTNANPNFRITGGRGANGNEGYGLFSTLTGGTMTERMRIDSSGNVGIGETSAGSYRLNIKTGASAGILLNGTGTGGSWMAWANSGTVNGYIASAYHIFASGSATDFGIVATNNLIFGQLNAERMRLTSDGNLGIGTTNPSQILTLSSSNTTGTAVNIINSSAGGYNWNIFSVGSAASLAPVGSLAFRDSTNGVTRMFMTSSGDVSINNATPNGKLRVTQTSTSDRTITATAPVSYQATIFRGDCAAASATDWYHLYGSSSGGIVNNIFIYGNGNIQNANNSYGGISDIKLKENITDATPKLDKLMQVKVRNYNLIGEYDQHKQLGVIAQELETIFPGLIEETQDRGENDEILETTTKSVKYSVFIPMLIKAIQEQQAIITQLQADVAALKGAK